MKRQNYNSTISTYTQFIRKKLNIKLGRRNINKYTHIFIKF